MERSGSALLGGVFVGCSVGVSVGMVSGLFSGVVAGLIAAVIMVLGFSLFLKESKDQLSLHHVAETEVVASREDLLDICADALKSTRGVRNVSCDEAHFRLSAATGVNWKTWGDILHVEIGMVDPNRSRIRVASRPRLATTVFDAGRSKENVDAVIGRIELLVRQRKQSRPQ